MSGNVGRTQSRGRGRGRGRGRRSSSVDRRSSAHKGQSSSTIWPRLGPRARSGVVQERRGGGRAVGIQDMVIVLKKTLNVELEANDDDKVDGNSTKVQVYRTMVTQKKSAGYKRTTLQWNENNFVASQQTPHWTFSTRSIAMLLAEAGTANNCNTICVTLKKIAQFAELVDSVCECTVELEAANCASEGSAPSSKLQVPHRIVSVVKTMIHRYFLFNDVGSFENAESQLQFIGACLLLTSKTQLDFPKEVTSELIISTLSVNQKKSLQDWKKPVFYYEFKLSMDLCFDFKFLTAHGFLWDLCSLLSIKHKTYRARLLTESTTAAYNSTLVNRCPPELLSCAIMYHFFAYRFETVYEEIAEFKKKSKKTKDSTVTNDKDTQLTDDENEETPATSDVSDDESGADDDNNGDIGDIGDSTVSHAALKGVNLDTYKQIRILRQPLIRTTSFGWYQHLGLDVDLLDDMALEIQESYHRMSKKDTPCKTIEKMFEWVSEEETQILRSESLEDHDVGEEFEFVPKGFEADPKDEGSKGNKNDRKRLLSRYVWGTNKVDERNHENLHYVTSFKDLNELQNPLRCDLFRNELKRLFKVFETYLISKYDDRNIPMVLGLISKHTKPQSNEKGPLTLQDAKTKIIATDTTSKPSSTVTIKQKEPAIPVTIEPKSAIKDEALVTLPSYSRNKNKRTLPTTDEVDETEKDAKKPKLEPHATTTSTKKRGRFEDRDERPDTDTKDTSVHNDSKRIKIEDRLGPSQHKHAPNGVKTKKDGGMKRPPFDPNSTNYQQIGSGSSGRNREQHKNNYESSNHQRGNWNDRKGSDHASYRNDRNYTNGRRDQQYPQQRSSGPFHNNSNNRQSNNFNGNRYSFNSRNNQPANHNTNNNGSWQQNKQHPRFSDYRINPQSSTRTSKQQQGQPSNAAVPQQQQPQQFAPPAFPPMIPPQMLTQLSSTLPNFNFLNPFNHANNNKGKKDEAGTPSNSVNAAAAATFGFPAIPPSNGSATTPQQQQQQMAAAAAALMPYYYMPHMYYTPEQYQSMMQGQQPQFQVPQQGQQMQQRPQSASSNGSHQNNSNNAHRNPQRKTNFKRNNNKRS